MARIRQSECSSVLYETLKNYFKNRSSIVRSTYDKIERNMQKGCPQDSILRPAAWNWCMDDLLLQFEQEINEDDVGTIAYADDLALLLKADSRRGIEDLGRN